MNMKKICKGIAVTVGVPLLAFLLLSLLCQANGKELFRSPIDFRAFVKNTVVTSCLAWAISFNLMTGRFDFSLGAVSILSVIIGGNLAIKMGLGPVELVLFSAVVGGVLSLISGIVYIIFNLSPIIVTLGITLIYESLTYSINKAKGVNIIGLSVYSKITDPAFAFTVCGIILVVLVILFNYTKFGYNARALAHGQAVSVHSGIHEKKNAIGCFLLSGIVVSFAGCMNLAFDGKINSTLGLGTMSVIFSAFLPIFLGDFIGRYSERNIGILMGSIVTSLLSLTYSKFYLQLSTQEIINAVALLLFLVYISNEKKILSWLNRSRKAS